MSIRYAEVPELREQTIPHHQFDDSIGIDNPRPSPMWQPSPDQITSWCLQIRQSYGHIRTTDPGAESILIDMEALNL